MALDDILLEAEEKMTKTEDVVQKEFAGVRTGKASPSLVENILVEVYGSQMRIRELAGEDVVVAQQGTGCDARHGVGADAVGVLLWFGERPDFADFCSTHDY